MNREIPAPIGLFICGVLLMTKLDSEKCGCRDLDLLAAVAGAEQEPEFRQVKPGETVWESAAGDGHLIVVKVGSVRVYETAEGSPRARLAHVVGAGHWVGVESIAGVRGNTRVVAAEPTTVAIIAAKTVFERVASNPSLARELIRHLAEQNVELSNEITQMHAHDCTAQVALALLRLARCGGAADDEGTGRVTLRITQQDVADAVGIARETVNAMIQRLADSGAIQKQRGRISFDPQVLSRQAASGMAGEAVSRS